MGVNAICIEGRFPNLRIVPCGASPSASEPVSFAIPTVPLPLMVDDDGSLDGMIALLYFLNNPAFDIQAVTISYGEAHPEVFGPQVANLLADMGRNDIPVGYGEDAPLEGSNSFPESWRDASNAFWNIPLPKSSQAITPVPAVELIIDTIHQSEKPVTLFLSGAHTNLATALRDDPSIKENIAAVYIMGGSVYTPSNIHHDFPEIDNEVAEWNIWVDPVAAAAVFSSGLNLHLIPLDATRDVLWSKQDMDTVRKSGAPEAERAADLMQIMLGISASNQIYIWDLVTAVQTTTPIGCAEEKIGLAIDTGPGPHQGQTIITDQTANISVCLDPDPEKIKGIVLHVFQIP